MVNVNFGGIRRDTVLGGSNYFGNGFYYQHHGRVVTVNGHLNGSDQKVGMGLSNGFTNTTIHCGRDRAESNVEQIEGSQAKPGSDEFVRPDNSSMPLVASLYVPRNDKLVKIDGNLIIHSILASEKSMASGNGGMKSSEETGLAVARNMPPAIPLTERNNGKHPHLYRSTSEPKRALGSGSADKDNLKSTPADGKLQQWFQEGLAGPMLSSGMCTEVFQFDVSPVPGAIVPAPSVVNVSAEHRRNTTHIIKGLNRRILHGVPIPLPGSQNNISKEHVGRNPEKDDFHGNKSLSSMVVSVLVDPRDAGDIDNDGVMGPPKSLSRIFVVVLIDSVKYVTYSCMLPLMGSCVLRVESLPEADKIMVLPGQPQVSFQQFGGYITVDEQQDRALFYYFAEAETDPSSKPLVLWLNGGPGCSSIGVGAFCEHGPFKQTEHVLAKTDYSWNKEANMLYLESPAGVGFFYSANKSFYASVTDDMTGHYGPQPAQLIIQSKMKFNLKGNSLEQSQTDTLTPICSGLNNQASREISKFIDKYDVTLDVCSSSIGSQAQVLNQLQDTKNIDVCVEDETVTYLNWEDVQKAFHARLVGVTAWSVYSTVLHYEKKNLEIPTIHVLGSLVKSGIRVLVFSGDQASVIPLLGTHTLVNELAKELGLKTTVPYRVWFEGRQVAGWTQVYGDILSFATIRGAAHEAPFSQPERLLVLFNSFLGGNPPPEAVLSAESI
ncbi:Serine carboxypeptidase-like 45 [Camellia lanceoleosa]|uniref:Serine carboxypeptidase-like 45 n=1 Tax=Camellia lanceoleosa TaxID=1840588 RepID=A0ACC0FXQ9_9ERIC|nr:Serine carboxypeptidase-like 45 [Camellia lanceoleosa]